MLRERAESFQHLQITSSEVKLHIKWAVSLVIAYGHFERERERERERDVI